MRARLSAVLVTAAVASLLLPAEAHAATVSTLFSDNFSSGFSVATNGKWQLLPTAKDGVTTTSAKGVTVVPTGRNARTGKPAFTTTAPQASGSQQGFLDHAKWVALPRATSSTGVIGFDAPASGSLTCTSTMAAVTTSTEDHPFGKLVADPQTDLRLAAGTMFAIDLQTDMAFDFMVTNTEIFAFYERVREPGSTYAAFSYAVPVQNQTPGQQHTYSVSLDQNRSRVTWSVDGRLALQLNGIGRRVLDRKFMLLDEGGAEQTVSPRQLACGVGTVTLLDGVDNSGTALVRLDSAPNYYFQPRTGAATAPTFFDNAARPENRLWGQGAQLQVASVTVKSQSG